MPGTPIYLFYLYNPIYNNAVYQIHPVFQVLAIWCPKWKLINQYYIIVHCMYLKMLFSMTSQTEDILWHNCS